MLHIYIYDISNLRVNWQFIIDVSEERTASVLKIRYSVVLCILCVCVLCWFLRHVVAQVVEVLCYKPEVACSIPDVVLPAALWHWS